MGPRLRDPLGNVLAVRAPSYHVRWFLYEALWLAQLFQLCRRRHLFQEAAPGVDVALTLRLLKSGMVADDGAASKRLVLAGGTVTQSVASKWPGHVMSALRAGV